MLGRAVHKEARSSPLKVISTARMADPEFIYFDCLHSNLESLISEVKPKFILNNIGFIKQKVRSESLDRETVRLVNSDFPQRLAGVAASHDARVIQIATDCVFSGSKGPYLESSVHDATDLYGITKSYGEIDSDNVLNIRCSVVGIEQNSHYSLWSWLLNQPRNAIVDGYENHLWNGVTTQVFAKLMVNLVRSEDESHGTFHLVPDDFVSKFELLNIFAKHSRRSDLEIRSVSAPEAVDRRLATNYPEVNTKLWRTAGFSSIPKVCEMITMYDEGKNNGG
jgi:dTDP-4-dehydrorhamnose reductase